MTSTTTSVFQLVPDNFRSSGFGAACLKAPAVEVMHRKREDARILDLVEGTTRRRVSLSLGSFSQGREPSGSLSRQTEGLYPSLEKEGVKTVVAPDLRPDGVIGIGDLILMKCKKERHTERVREKRIIGSSFLPLLALRLRRWRSKRVCRVIKILTTTESQRSTHRDQERT
jgi:hypothetical protein